MLRPLTRKRTAPPYERARLAADALRARAQAVGRTDRPADRAPEQTTDVDTVNQTRRMLAEAVLARILEGARERALLAHGSRPQPAVAAPPRHTQQPEPSTHRAEPQEESGEHPATPGSREEPPRRRAVAPAPLPAEPDRERGSAPRCPRPVPSAALQPLAVVTMLGTAHRVGSTRWAPPGGLHFGAPGDDGRHRGARTTPVRHRTRCAAPPGDVRHSRAPVRRTRCPAPHRCAHRRPPPPSGAAGGARPLVQLCYTPLSRSATATFSLIQGVSGSDRCPQGGGERLATDGGTPLPSPLRPALRPAQLSTRWVSWR